MRKTRFTIVVAYNHPTYNGAIVKCLLFCILGTLIPYFDGFEDQ